jgi:hypothetical protein
MKSRFDSFAALACKWAVSVARGGAGDGIQMFPELFVDWLIARRRAPGCACCAKICASVDARNGVECFCLLGSGFRSSLFVVAATLACSGATTGGT